MNNLTIIKKIAKQGENLVLIIPKNLHPFLQRGDLVKVQIDKLQVEDAETQRKQSFLVHRNSKISRESKIFGTSEDGGKNE